MKLSSLFYYLDGAFGNKCQHEHLCLPLQAIHVNSHSQYYLYIILLPRNAEEKFFHSSCRQDGFVSNLKTKPNRKRTKEKKIPFYVILNVTLIKKETNERRLAHSNRLSQILKYKNVFKSSFELVMHVSEQVSLPNLNKICTSSKHRN